MQSELQNQKPIKKTSPVVHFAVSMRENSTPARCQALAINYYFGFFHKRSHLGQSQLLQAYV
jgi:hypothetical protein